MSAFAAAIVVPLLVACPYLITWSDKNSSYINDTLTQRIAKQHWNLAPGLNICLTCQGGTSSPHAKPHRRECPGYDGHDMLERSNHPANLEKLEGQVDQGLFGMADVRANPRMSKQE